MSNRCNVASYLNSINSILNQDLDGVRVVLSSCMNQPNDIGMLQAQLGASIDYTLIHEILPVNVTFNHTVLEGSGLLRQFVNHAGHDPEVEDGNGSCHSVSEALGWWTPTRSKSFS